tara:strand:+ start:265 stop:627 length:363 start_codon:yes stop_codon:yes gene_type:complete
MRITERRLRKIIRKVIKEEEEMPAYTNQGPVKDHPYVVHEYKGMSGSTLIGWIIVNGMDKSKLPDADLNQAAIVLGEYKVPGHSSVGRSRRRRYRHALAIIKKRFAQAPEEFNKAHMYEI